MVENMCTCMCAPSVMAWTRVIQIASIIMSGHVAAGNQKFTKFVLDVQNLNKIILEQRNSVEVMTALIEEQKQLTQDLNERIDHMNQTTQHAPEKGEETRSPSTCSFFTNYNNSTGGGAKVECTLTNILQVSSVFFFRKTY